MSKKEYVGLLGTVIKNISFIKLTEILKRATFSSPLQQNEDAHTFYVWQDRDPFF